MVDRIGKFLSKGKSMLAAPQGSILSAAAVIMIMIVASRILGLGRQRILAHYFTADELSLFFAAFRLPDLVFEVLVFGTFSSAFIPVFTNVIKKDEKEAWNLASTITNLGLIAFVLGLVVILVFADSLYGVFTPGYSLFDQLRIADYAKVLFLAQGFFLVSYVLTAVLESLKRFLVPALAPLFYNLGIILGTILLSDRLGLWGPVVGVVIGAAVHFLIQLPLASKMGFRFKTKIILDDGARRIGKLALPRLIEVSFLQVSKTIELSLASLVSSAAYTYFTFGNSLYLLPVGLFGTSIAKAALPTLSSQSDNPEEFAKTFWTTFSQMLFLVLPMAAFIAVLRIPLVRLIFGTNIFTWESTVQTGQVVSAFSLAIIFQTLISLLSRAFYSLHNTRTPVAVSIGCIVLNIILDIVLVGYLHYPIWGLAFAFSVSSGVQVFVLLLLLLRRLNKASNLGFVGKLIKMIISTGVSGLSMYLLLKFFDKYAWIKRLSFLGKIDFDQIHFEKFVLDTSYTINLLILTVMVCLVGLSLYVFMVWLLGVPELKTFAGLYKRISSSPTQPLDSS